MVSAVRPLCEPTTWLTVAVQSIPRMIGVPRAALAGTAQTASSRTISPSRRIALPLVFEVRPIALRHVDLLRVHLQARGLARGADRRELCQRRVHLGLGFRLGAGLVVEILGLALRDERVEIVTPLVIETWTHGVSSFFTSSGSFAALLLLRSDTGAAVWT